MRPFLASVTIATLSFVTQSVATDPSNVETAPPVVVKTEPQSGAVDVDPQTKEIRITFSKEMQDQAWSLVVVKKEVFPPTTGKPRYLDDHRTCVVPVALEGDHTYSMWLNSPQSDKFHDTEQRPAVPYLLVFKTLSSKK